MKRKIAAISVAFLLLTACSSNAVSSQQTPANSVSALEAEVPVSQQTQDSVTLPSVPEGQKPVVTEETVVGNFKDEPYEVHTDFEEIVSLSLTLPRLTLDSEDAAAAINSVFEKLQENLNDFASTTVYETAQENHTIGFLEGSYTATIENGILMIDYTLVERYANSDAETVHENVYRFDAATGEQLDA